MFQVLTQDGPLSKTVCRVTTDLIRLGDQCFEKDSMDALGKSLPAGTKAGSRLGALVGGELHKILYNLAVRARENGTLERRIKITRPTDLKVNPAYTRKGERSSAGPDFVLTGIFNEENIHAAWDFTTSRGLASHYDRDVLGIRHRHRSNLQRSPLDGEIQDVPDTVNFWTSYVAIFY